LGNGNTVVVELAEALAAVVPVDRPHFLFASDGAAAVEQALKIAFQFFTNQGVSGRTRYLAFGGAYHGDTVGSLSLGDGGFGTDGFDPPPFPLVRPPGSAAGVRPDLLCVGKGLTGGYLPMSATAASQRVYDAFLGEDLSERTFYHGHSYSGNALAAAVALRHLQLIGEWSVLENVRARSEQLA